MATRVTPLMTAYAVQPVAAGVAEGVADPAGKTEIGVGVGVAAISSAGGALT
jgi:hypothetical protein